MSQQRNASMRAAWSFATTGMRLVEYRGPWRRESGRIAIRSGKQRGAEVWRVVPDLGRCVRVRFRCKVFRAALDTASQGQMRPCDLRRSIANCLESAGVPRTRRQLYMGHGAKEITDLYERHEVCAFIAQDSDHLARYIADDCRPKRRPSP